MNNYGFSDQEKLSEQLQLLREFSEDGVLLEESRYGNVVLCPAI